MRPLRVEKFEKYCFDRDIKFELREQQNGFQFQFSRKVYLTLFDSGSVSWQGKECKKMTRMKAEFEKFAELRLRPPRLFS